MIPLFKTAMAGNASLNVARVLNSGYIGQGSQVEWFETALKELIKYPYLVTVNSGTSALTLALRMLRLPYATKVLTTPLTCMATTAAIRANTLTPLWCDIDPRTLNICLQDVRLKLTRETRVLMLVHWGGYPIDMDEVESIKKHYKERFDHELIIVEDCAHSWGSTFKNKQLGTTGNYAAYSFGPIKPLTCGDGGLLILPDQPAMERAKLLRWYGIDRNDRDCDIEECGLKYHMNDINAAIGMANLEMSKHLVIQHQRNSGIYDVQLQNIPGLKILERHKDHRSSCWLYTILVERRSDFMLRMLENDIEAKPVHKRNDQYTCVDYLQEPLPRLDSVYESIVCIPVGWWVKIDERNHIINTIRKGW